MTRKLYPSILLLLSLQLSFAAGPPRKIFDLTKAEWKFKQADKEQWFDAQIPGSVHSDLLRNHLIPDPYVDNNELELRWIEEKNWEYHCTFKASSALLKYEKIELNFKGLDTYSVIYINGEKLGSSNNMFRKWSFDVKPWLKEGDNSIRILFESPLNHNRKIVEGYPLELPSGNETVDLKVSPFTRKATYQFGWDWAPRFVGCGIWKEVSIEAWQDLRIVRANCETLEIKENKAKMKLEVEIESQYAKGHYQLKYLDHKFPIKLEPGSNVLKYEFEIENPELWWPNGWGEAKMHEMKLDIIEGGFSREAFEFDYAIRTVELVNQADSIGTSFYFKINGLDLFARGANYVPQDMFLDRVEDKDYEDLIEKVKAANMNMLRVWGGGIYEKEIFYELCDENGIMVWQDFMFANSLYPSSLNFKKNISQELVENINRLKSHPSIVLWCGNNEIEVAWGNWGWQNQYKYSYTDSVSLWNNQLEIFHHLIPDILNDLYPSATYTATSPLSNWGTPSNFNHSSMHYWGVWHGKEAFENFKTNVGRFMVEYGFQSFPDYKHLKAVIQDSSLHLESKVMKNRQKSYIGNGLITQHSERWFGTATSFEEFVEKSQKTQALALFTAILQHRLNSPHCMGTLFWQLNDCWQGPSWSILNYDRSPKVAYSLVKDWYANTVVIPQKRGDKLELFAVHSGRESFNGDLWLELDGEAFHIEIQDLLPNSPKKLTSDIKFVEGELKLKLKGADKTEWQVKIPSFFLL